MESFPIISSGISKPVPFLYLICVLKDSCVRNERVQLAWESVDYLPGLSEAILAISKLTTSRPESGAGFPLLQYKIAILSGTDGEPSQARIIIRCAPGWRPDRFEDEAVKMLRKNDWVDEVISHTTHWSDAMQMGFLEAGKAPVA